MKKTLLTLFVSAFALVAGAQNVATQVAGEYVGDLWVALGAPVDTTDVDTKMPGQSITMEAGVAEGTIDFALYNFQFSGTPVGDIMLDAVPVSADEAGTVTFGDNPVVPLSLLGGIIQATAQINTAESLVRGDSIYAKIDVVWTNGPVPTPINVFFKGKKTVQAGIDDALTTTGAAVSAGVEGVYTTTGVKLRPNGDTTGLPAGIYIINNQKVIVK